MNMGVSKIVFSAQQDAFIVVIAMTFSASILGNGLLFSPFFSPMEQEGDLCIIALGEMLSTFLWYVVMICAISQVVFLASLKAFWSPPLLMDTVTSASSL